MANFIYSKLIIEPQEAMNKVCDIIHKIPQVPFGHETKAIVQTFYSQEEIKRNISETIYSDGSMDNPISENGVNHNWLRDNVGTNWITLEYDEGEILMNSPTNLPDGFLVKLYGICVEEFSNVSIYCKWWDETETQCGVALVKNGFYTEDEVYLDSEEIHHTSYYPSGFENLAIVLDWLKSNLNEESPLTIEELDEMGEDDIRELFSDRKLEEKWNTINNKWDDMYYSCEYAIENEYFEYENLKIKKIAKKRYEMITNCYPF